MSTDNSYPMKPVFKNKSLIEVLEKYGIDPTKFQDLVDVKEIDLPSGVDEPPKKLLFVFHGNIYACYFVVGSKRWGKSVDGDTEILICINEITDIIKISELESVDLQNVVIKIPAIDLQTKKVIWSRITNFYKHKPADRLYRVTTNTGKTVIATGDHSFLVNGKTNRIESKKLKDITNDDILPCINKLASCDSHTTLDFSSLLFGNKNILDGKAVNDLLKDLEINNIPIYSDETDKYIRKHNLHGIITKFAVRNWRNGHRIPPELYKIYGSSSHLNPINRYIQMSKSGSFKSGSLRDIYSSNTIYGGVKEFGYIFGIYLSDGSVTYSSKQKKSKSAITLSNTNKDILDYIERCLNKIGIEKFTRTDNDIRFNSVPFGELLNTLFGSGAENKFIHPILLNCGLDLLGGLISGYIDGDGEVSESNGSLVFGFTSRSVRLVRDFQLVLSRFGILSRLKDIRNIKGINYYRASIPSTEARKFIYKTSDLYSIDLQDKRKKNILLDTVSRQSSGSNVSFSMNHYNIDPTESKLITTGSTQQDVFGDRIIHRETVSGDNKFVYDIETEHHTFMLANGLFVHNSTWLEWAAEKFWQHDYLTMDLYDAGDFESCYWGIRTCKMCHRPLRYDEKVCPDCQLTPKKANDVLMVVPDYVDIEIQDPAFKLFPIGLDDDDCLPDIAKIAMKENRVVSLASGLFNEDHLFLTLTEWMYQWLQINRDQTRTDTCILLREAADVAFSRKKTSTSKHQSAMGKSLINLIRKAGHVRTVLLFDSQRYMELDIGVRGNIPYTIVKHHSKNNMPRVVTELNDQIKQQRESWYYDYNIDPDIINRKRPEITYLRKNEFYVQFDDGTYALARNQFPTFHHKRVTDYFDLLTDMDFSQELFKIQRNTKIQTIRDVPKNALLGLAYNLNSKYGLSVKSLAKEFGREERTIKSWLKQAQRSP